jgi:sugar phosphate permease
MSRGEHGKSIFSGLRYVLSNRQTWLVAIITSLLYLPVGTFGALWGDSFMATCLNMGTAGAANADAMLFIGLGVSAPLMGWFADRTGHRRRVLVIGLCVALVGSVLLLFLTPAYADAMFPLLFMLGFGCGAIVIAFPMAIDLNPHFARGAAITFVNFFQMLLAGLGQWLIGVLLDWGETDKLAAVYSVDDFRKAFLMLPVGLVLALVLTVFLRNTKSDS